MAKDHARRSGMTLGAWLNHVILEDDLPEDVTTESQFAARRAAADAPRRDGPRLVAGTEAPDLARVAVALDRLADRIEASETRTGMAINAVTARLDGALDETAARQGDFGDRLRRMEEAKGPRAETVRLLEGRMAHADPDAIVETVLKRLGERVAQAEHRTADALEGLRVSLTALDQRVWSVEREAGDAADSKFESLGQVLTHRVEALRAEVAQKLAEAPAVEVEHRLAQMAEHVRAAERRSTQAVEEIGRQVLSMAEAVGKKLAEVDHRGAEAIDQVGTEVARIAGAVELRLARGEQTQAEAFERLTGELTRATDRLAQRLTASEARAALAIEGVGDQVARVTERIEARHDRTASDVAERLRQSEERAEHLLREARSAPVAPDPELAPPPTAALGEEFFKRVETSFTVAPQAEEPEPAEQAPESDSERETVTAEWRRLDLEVPEPEVPETFAPIGEAEDDDLFAPEPSVEDPAPAGSPQLSTREVIEQARAAARAQRAQDVPPIAPVSAKVGPKDATGRLFQGFGQAFGRPRRTQNTAMQTALMVAGGAAFLSVGAAGLTLMQPAGGSGTLQETAASSLGPRAAVALTPGFAPGPATVAPPAFTQVKADVEAGMPGALQSLRALAESGNAQAQLYLGQLYDTGEAGLVRDPIEARRLTALAAEAGDAAAMHNLGVYAFRGEGGPSDFTLAAVWFKRAAAAGVVESQYNLGLLYQSGSGVRKDLTEARRWFREAADRGDAEARRALAGLEPEVRPRPAPPARRPASVARTAAVAEPAASPNVKQAQAILTRLGYYSGPADGRANEAYKVALFRYQQDQREQASGPKPYAALDR